MFRAIKNVLLFHVTRLYIHSCQFLLIWTFIFKCAMKLKFYYFVEFCTCPQLLVKLCQVLNGKSDHPTWNSIKLIKTIYRSYFLIEEE